VRKPQSSATVRHSSLDIRSALLVQLHKLAYNHRVISLSYLYIRNEYSMIVRRLLVTLAQPIFVLMSCNAVERHLATTSDIKQVWVDYQPARRLTRWPGSAVVVIIWVRTKCGPLYRAVLVDLIYRIRVMVRSNPAFCTNRIICMQMEKGENDTKGKDTLTLGRISLCDVRTNVWCKCMHEERNQYL